eukprot:INCI14282.1.p1 GENE.INCI14282.1~~INCI14282.1.p1  ORF type:complete len:1376 (-),score=207.89 INCI14282.1:1182-4718(-)
MAREAAVGHSNAVVQSPTQTRLQGQSLAGGIRGGLLCDAPGLGKTVTILALVLKAAGVARTCLPKWDEDAYQKRRLQYGWLKMLPEDRRATLLQELGTLRGLRRGYIFDQPVNFGSDKMAAIEYSQIISRPASFESVRGIIASFATMSDGSAALENFQREIELCFDNAEKFHPPGSFIANAAIEMRAETERHISLCRRRIADHSGCPDSQRDHSIRKLIDKLPSRATLIVVPRALLTHWREQLERHVTWEYLLSSDGPDNCNVLKAWVDDGFGCVRSNLSTCRPTSQKQWLRRPLPSASALASYLVVVISSTRLAQESRLYEATDCGQGKLFSSLSPMKRGRRVRRQVSQASVRLQSSGTKISSLPTSRAVEERGSALHKVYWLRIVVDEGHVLGQNTNSSSAVFVRALEAKHRWIMSGTPTTEKSTHTTVQKAHIGLNNLFHLLCFLRHQPYGMEGGRQLWARDVRTPLLQLQASRSSDSSLSGSVPIVGDPSQNLMSASPNDTRQFDPDVVQAGTSAAHRAYSFAVALMSEVMVRTIKSDVKSIFPPVRTIAVLKFSQLEARTYNTIVTHMKTNILMTMEAGNGVCNDLSLLHPKNHGSAMQLMTNLRIACSGGGGMTVSIRAQNFEETLEILRTKYGADAARLAMAQQFMRRATSGQDSPCAKCGRSFEVLLLQPCAHLICVQCLESCCGGLQQISQRSTYACGELYCRGYAKRKRMAVPDPHLQSSGASANLNTVKTPDQASQSAPQESAGQKHEWVQEEWRNRIHVVDLQIIQPGFDLSWSEALAQSQQVAMARLRYPNHQGTPNADEDLAFLPPVAAAASMASSAAADPDHATSNSKVAEFVCQNSKSMHMIKKIERLRKSHADLLAAGKAETMQRQWCRVGKFLHASNPDHHAPAFDFRAPKIVVFSEHSRTLNKIGDDLVSRFGMSAVAEFSGEGRDGAVCKFRDGVEQRWTCGRCGSENNRAFSHCQQMVINAVTESGSVVHVPASDTTGLPSKRPVGTGDSLSVPNHGIIHVQDVSECRALRRKASNLVWRDVDCFILLLGKDGSHGLDLSFVTHIYLLEKIWDAAVEEQVVARAYRMGASHAVHVEQLIMRDSIEEIVHQQFGSTSDIWTQSSAQSSQPVRPILSQKQGTAQLQFVMRNMRLTAKGNAGQDNEDFAETEEGSSDLST